MISVSLRSQSEFVLHGTDTFDTSTMRLIPGARRQGDVWVCPATRAQAVMLSHLYGKEGLNPTGEVRRHVSALWDTAAPGCVELDPRTMPFQAEAVATLLSAGSALLGSEMGLGKTVQAILWMANTAPRGKHLVVCPNSLKFTWAAELERWLPEMPVVVVDGTADQRRKQLASYGAGVLVINYESLRVHTKLAHWGGRALTAAQREPKELNDITWDTVVVDEAHRIKSPGSLQTLAVKQMGAQAKHRLALTGTPLLSTPDDVWSIMNFVAPDEWGSRTWFREALCLMEETWASGQARLENAGLNPERRTQFDQIFTPRFVRHTKAEVLPQLPAKRPMQYRQVALTTKQAKVYSGLVDDMMATVGDELLVAQNPLTLLIRLRQAASATPVVDAEGNVTALEMPSNKVTACLEIMEEVGGDPVVFYCESRKLAILLHTQLEKAGHRSGLVHGEIDAPARAGVVERFQDGQLDAFVGTLGAAAEGITLTRADTIVLVQQSWSHAQNAQAIDRIHRIGQNSPVQPIALLSRDTVDLAVRATATMKQKQLEDLVRDPDTLAKLVRGKL